MPGVGAHAAPTVRVSLDAEVWLKINTVGKFHERTKSSVENLGADAESSVFHMVADERGSSLAVGECVGISVGIGRNAS